MLTAGVVAVKLGDDVVVAAEVVAVVLEAVFVVVDVAVELTSKKREHQLELPQVAAQ